MNILVLSWRDPKHPMAGGAEQVMHEHMKGWAKAGHSVTLFSSRMKGLAAKEDLDGVKIVRGGYQYLGVQVAGFFYYLKNRDKIDFVVDQFHGIPFFTPFYVNVPKLAVIQEPAREVWLMNPLSFPLNYLIGFIGYFGEPFLFWLFYKNTPFMTGSESARQELIKLGVPQKNIFIVPHGVVLPRSKGFDPKSKIKTITYFGVLSKDKGIEDAIGCFSILAKKRKYNFWVMGKTESQLYKRKILNKVSALGLKGKVKFWGRVSERKKFELLARSWVLVNPSIREGWGLVNIEANAMGTPVVAYSSPGLVDSVKDGVSGILCKKSSYEYLARDVHNLLSDKKRYESLRKTAILWSKNFDWKNSVKESLTLIEKLYNS